MDKQRLFYWLYLINETIIRVVFPGRKRINSKLKGLNRIQKAHYFTWNKDFIAGTL